jgi:hypothetical protein
MPGIIGKFGTHHRCFEIGLSQLFHFLRHHQQTRRIGKSAMEQLTHLIRSQSDLIERDDRGLKLKLPRVPQPPKLLGRLLPFVIELAADDRSIEIQCGCMHALNHDTNDCHCPALIQSPPSTTAPDTYSPSSPPRPPPRDAASVLAYPPPNS